MQKTRKNRRGKTECESYNQPKKSKKKKERTEKLEPIMPAITAK